MISRIPMNPIPAEVRKSTHAFASVFVSMRYKY